MSTAYEAFPVPVDNNRSRCSVTDTAPPKAAASTPVNTPHWPLHAGLFHAGPQQHRSMRFFSTARPRTLPDAKLTHVDDAGKARMVDVNHKGVTERMAIASATVHVGPEIAKLIEQNSVKKGDVMSIAQIAGIIGAKRTSEIIPLCHNIPISSVVINTELNLSDSCVSIRATVKCEGKTGVEMEALCAVSTAALTIYDMCKAMSKHITISDIMLLKKSGGKQNFQRADFVDISDDANNSKDGQQIHIKNFNTEPIVTKEPFYPTHI